MEKLFMVKHEICNYIESLQYEVNVRKDIIAFIEESSNKKLMLKQLCKYNKELEEFDCMYKEGMNILIELSGVKNEFNEIICTCLNSKTGIFLVKGQVKDDK